LNEERKLSSQLTLGLEVEGVDFSTLIFLLFRYNVFHKRVGNPSESVTPNQRTTCAELSHTRNTINLEL
jgi:hypothetical protein